MAKKTANPVAPKVDATEAAAAPAEAQATAPATAPIPDVAIPLDEMSALRADLAAAKADLVAESARAGAAEGRERDLKVKIETMERDAKYGQR